MKNIVKIATALLITTAAFASDSQKESIFKKDNSYKTTYIRFGSSAMPGDGSYVIAPGVTAGWQYKENRQGVDISASGFRSNKESEAEVYSYTLPKVQYLAFLQGDNPKNNHNAYFGLGGSLFTLNVEKEKKEENKPSFFETTKKYTGLAANASVGYNYRLGKKLQSSIQLGATMPTPLAFNSKGEVYKPSFDLNLGLGF